MTLPPWEAPSYERHYLHWAGTSTDEGTPSSGGSATTSRCHHRSCQLHGRATTSAGAGRSHPPFFSTSALRSHRRIKRDHIVGPEFIILLEVLLWARTEGLSSSSSRTDHPIKYRASYPRRTQFPWRCLPNPSPPPLWSHCGALHDSLDSYRRPQSRYARRTSRGLCHAFS